MTVLLMIVTGSVGLGSPVQPHVADFNASFSVDLADLAVFNNAFGAGIGDPLMPTVPYRAADLDADGDIDGGDWVLFLAAMTGPPQVRACASIDDCDDHNPCSSDWCNLTLLRCEHYDYPTCCHNDFECADFDPCTSVCRDEPGGSPYPFCKSVIRSCCFFDSQCDDGIACTQNTCDSSHTCVYVPFAPCCGNGEVEKGEECDDGDVGTGDGCDAACQVEGPDQCSMADPISDGTTAFSNRWTTSDGPGYCGGMGSDVWYEYTAACSGTVNIDTFGSTFNTLVTAYDGCSCLGSPLSDCCHPHETVGCSDPACQAAVCTADTFCCTDHWDGFCVVRAGNLCGGLCTAWPDPVLACDDSPSMEQSSISFNALAGNCYKLQVGGYSGQQGWGLINIDSGCCGDGDLDPGEECESNDDCLGHPGGPACVGCVCTCRGLQEACSNSSECCDENDAYCDFNSCGGTTCCLPPGRTCSGDCDCCDSGVCRDGVCCNPFGAFCLFDFDCCGGFDARCEADHCCGAPGAPCQSSFDCCGNEVCGIWNTCCLPAGNSCNHDDDCCDSDVCSDGICCHPLGQLCSLDSDCCGFDAQCGDFGVCCGGPGTSCNSSIECCDNGSCDNGSCCRPLGGSCLSEFDCCGFSAGCDFGFCCAGPGMSCQSEFDCCGDGVCDFGTCCSLEGGACQSDDDCCGPELVCRSGVCIIT